MGLQFLWNSTALYLFRCIHCIHRTQVTKFLSLLISSSFKSFPSPTLSFMTSVSYGQTIPDLTVAFCEHISQSNISDLDLPFEQTQGTVLYFIPSTFIGFSPVQMAPKFYCNNTNGRTIKCNSHVHSWALSNSWLSALEDLSPTPPLFLLTSEFYFLPSHFHFQNSSDCYCQECWKSNFSLIILSRKGFIFPVPSFLISFLILCPA